MLNLISILRVFVESNLQPFDIYLEFCMKLRIFSRTYALFTNANRISLQLGDVARCGALARVLYWLRNMVMMCT